MRIAIIGCGGHARSVADVLMDNDPDTNLVFFDSAAKRDELIFGRFHVFPIEGFKLDELDAFFVAVGDNRERAKFLEETKEHRDKLINVISRSAYLGFSNCLGIGTLIARNAHVGPESHIGDGCIINTSAVIEHEVRIGDLSHVSVNATVCGRCRIGNNVLIGAGATVKDSVSICNDVIVGAGATVITDIDERGIYVGVPIRKIK